MIVVTRADPAGIPLVVVCFDCVNDPTTIWQRPNDDFWAISLASWIRVHLRRSSVPPQTTWERTDRAGTPAPPARSPSLEPVPPEVIEAAKQLFEAAGGAGGLGVHSPTAPDPTGIDLTMVG